jgi:phage tail-like protein
MATSHNPIILSSNFEVVIEDMMGKLGFTTVSGISEEVAVREYIRCNDLKGALKIKGRSKQTPVTLSTGSGDVGPLLDWFKEVRKINSKGRPNTAAGGPVRDNTKRRVTIHTDLGDVSAPFASVTLIGAWPSKLEMSGLDASSNSVLIRSLTLVFDEVEWNM